MIKHLNHPFSETMKYEPIFLLKCPEGETDGQQSMFRVLTDGRCLAFARRGLGLNEINLTTVLNYKKITSI